MKNEKRFLLGVSSLRPKRKNKPVCVYLCMHTRMGWMWGHVGVSEKAES